MKKVQTFEPVFYWGICLSL